MDKRNFLEVGRYDTSTFHFFRVFWDTLVDIPLVLRCPHIWPNSLFADDPLEVGSSLWSGLPLALHLFPRVHSDSLYAKKKLNIEKHETIGGLDLPEGRELKEEVIENSKK